MTAVVIDSSLAAAWLLDDEYNPLADSVFRNLAENGGIVPELWHLEIRNTLLIAERRSRISASRIEECLSALEEMPISTDQAPNLVTCMTLAKKHNLTFYDAVYLEVALRRSAELATLDRALARAAQAEDVLVAG